MNINEISVKDFVKSFAEASPLEYQQLVDSIIKRTYVPLIEKNTLLTVMFNKAVVSNGVVKAIDYTADYVNYIVSILTMYTNIKFKENGNTIFDDYDMLRSSGALEAIMQTIPPSEIEEISMIHDFIKTEFYEREKGASFYLSKLFKTLEILGGTAISTLLNTIENDESEMSEDKEETI